MVTSILPLRAKNAHVKKRGKTIIGPIDLEIGTKGFTIIMGPNGAGKTTLLRLLHGLERPRNGSLTWNRDAADALSRQAFVFQTPIMLKRTTLQNITYALQLRKVPTNEATKIAMSWLEQTGLQDAHDLNAYQLSGGEKQKLAIARALACQPDVLFLDEPTANLDGKDTREIEELLKRALSQEIRIVMTTHDLGQCKRLAEDVIFMYKGKIHEQNEVSRFFEKQETPEARAFIKGDIVE